MPLPLSPAPRRGGLSHGSGRCGDARQRPPGRLAARRSPAPHGRGRGVGGVRERSEGGRERGRGACAAGGPRCGGRARRGDSSAQGGERRGRREGEGEPDFMGLERCHDLISLCLHSSNQALLWTVRMEGFCWDSVGISFVQPRWHRKHLVWITEEPDHACCGSCPWLWREKKEKQNKTRGKKKQQQTDLVFYFIA